PKGVISAFLALRKMNNLHGFNARVGCESHPRLHQTPKYLDVLSRIARKLCDEFFRCAPLLAHVTGLASHETIRHRFFILFSVAFFIDLSAAGRCPVPIYYLRGVSLLARPGMISAGGKQLCRVGVINLL
ncbi:MAG: hypothetical protein WA798_12760, partial [Candidatus Acidiferrum sp.]